MRDDDEYLHKFKLYEMILKDAKGQISDEISDKIKNINYREIVLENLVYDPDEGIEKDVIEDLQTRMIDELQNYFQSKVEELFESEPEPEPEMGKSNKKKKKNKSKSKRKNKSKQRNTRNTRK